MSIEHYVGHESFARNLFQDFKHNRDALPVWLDLPPADRAHWRRQALLLLREGQEQGPPSFFGTAAVKLGMPSP